MQTLRVCTAQRGLRPLDPCASLRRVYHCEVKALSRSAGRSAAGACAYISGSTARDVYTGAAFDYVSGCPLATPTGAMQGSYHMVAGDGSSFDVAIPKFALVAPAVAG